MRCLVSPRAGASGWIATYQVFPGACHRFRSRQHLAGPWLAALVYPRGLPYNGACRAQCRRAERATRGGSGTMSCKKTVRGGAEAPLAPGTHIRVRDEVWRILKVEHTSTGGQAAHVVGMTELVRDQEAVFLSEIEPSMEILDPVETKLVRDSSSGYRASLLYLESLYRRIPPTDERLHIGHRAAMDLLEYQLEPAAKALRQPRQRILIADGVGLGKTLEAGILLSELMARGRGKRILVVVLKSLLTQFQKEMWCRFTIPLVRLDSVGLGRIRRRIPTNHNPFHIFDKAIISIDTLKQNNEYRHYLETAHWDVIVIDEAQNVAVRGTNSSLRSRLARLLASRSDSLIMLSATPHDGRARSFASLMNMLGPTAIADEDDYTKEEIDGLYIRRFKNDIENQLGNAIPERETTLVRAAATPEEEAAYGIFSKLRFGAGESHRGGQRLFRTTLETALLSSPGACIRTIENRLRKIRRIRDSRRLEGGGDGPGAGAGRARCDRSPSRGPGGQRDATGKEGASLVPWDWELGVSTQSGTMVAGEKTWPRTTPRSARRVTFA